jgi:translation elongation factor EF-Tu-like GTPase
VTEDPASVRSATLVIVTESGPDGAREVHRKLAEDLGANRSASVVWVMTKMNLIDDRELLDLMQQEVRDLLKQKGAAPTKLQFGVDTDQTTVGPDTLKGWASITEFLQASSGN